MSPALSVAPPRQLNAITAPAAAEPSAASAAELHTPAPMRSLSPSPRCPPPPPEVAERAGAPAAAAASERGGGDGSGLIVTVGDGPPALELTVDAENACGDGEVGLLAVIRIAADAVTIGRGADDVVLDSRKYLQMVSRIHCRLSAAPTAAARGRGGARLGEWDGGERRRRRRLDARQARDGRGGVDGAVLCIGSWRARHRARCGTASLSSTLQPKRSRTRVRGCARLGAAGIAGVAEFTCIDTHSQRHRKARLRRLAASRRRAAGARRLQRLTAATVGRSAASASQHIPTTSAQQKSASPSGSGGRVPAFTRRTTSATDAACSYGRRSVAIVHSSTLSE